MNREQYIAILEVDVAELQQKNKQLKEQNELEFNDFVKFRKEQEDKHLEKTDKLIKENYHLKKQLKQKDEVIDGEQYVKIDFLIEMQKQITKAVGIAEQYAQIDGEHHKMWVIDQMLRELLGNNYNKWLEKYNYDSRENDYEEWNCGIAP